MKYTHSVSHIGHQVVLRRCELSSLEFPWKQLKVPHKTVYNAIKAGYRLLDGAGDYGNEKEAGEGVKRAISDGLVKREDLCE